ncbi:MAG: hypothetical protein ACE5GW_09135 [Planctomycetota bacterium]
MVLPRRDRRQESPPGEDGSGRPGAVGIGAGRALLPFLLLWLLLLPAGCGGGPERREEGTPPPSPPGGDGGPAGPAAGAASPSPAWSNPIYFHGIAFHFQRSGEESLPFTLPGVQGDSIGLGEMIVAYRYTHFFIQGLRYRFPPGTRVFLHAPPSEDEPWQMDSGGCS